MDQSEMLRWKAAVGRLGPRNRVHASREMSVCYRELAAIYPGTRILQVASGERSGTWVAPHAWEVEDARLISPDGRIVADWRTQPLSLFTYSPPFEGVVDRKTLDSHLFSIPSLPERTPFHFRNQYRHWDPIWGFSLPHIVRETLPEGNYRVEIRSRFEPGTMEMVEQVLQGEHADSILLVGHFDHPWMVLDGLIGCLAGHEVVTRLSAHKTKLSYRMLSTVEIIGSVFYAMRWAREANVRVALFVAAAGADAPLSYQTSFGGNSVIDQAARHILFHTHFDADIDPFRKGKLGNDEVAFDVVGVDVPCGSIMRAPFAEYHTDADTVSAVIESNVEETISLILRMVNILERNAVLERKFEGLPCLSAPDLDLYLSGSMMSQTREAVNETTRRLVEALPPLPREETMRRSANLQWLMNILPAMVDGKVTTLDVAEKVSLPFEAVDLYTDLWAEKGLLAKRWKHPFH